MADESDVEEALAQIVGAALYPGGPPDGAAPSTAGLPVRIYRGWPDAPALDVDLRAGTANVTVFAPNGTDRETSRYPLNWKVTVDAVETITATTAGSVVTLGGAASVPQNVALKVNRRAYVYAVQADDTLDSIAAALAALADADYPGTASAGPTIAVANPIGPVSAKVGGVGTASLELKRQKKQFQIVIWAPSPAARDAIAKVIDPALAATQRFTLPDQSVALKQYARSMKSDAPEKEMLFRRDLFYTVEYPTTQQMSAPRIIAFETKAESGGLIISDNFN